MESILLILLQICFDQLGFDDKMYDSRKMTQVEDKRLGPQFLF